MRSLLAACLAALATLPLTASAAERNLTLPPFHAIANNGAIDVDVTVGPAQSVVARGNDEFLSHLEASVVDGELRLSLRSFSGSISRLGDAHVAVAVPALARYALSGAGDTKLAKLHGDAFTLAVHGAGNVKADGEVGRVTVDAGGVGDLDLRALHARDAEVSLGGVGNVEVWASERLSGHVGGVGSLTYYGHPKQVDAKAGGIGSVSAGR